MKDFEGKFLKVGDQVVVAASPYTAFKAGSTLKRGVVESIDDEYETAMIKTGISSNPYHSKAIMKTSDGNVITASFKPRNGPVQVLIEPGRNKQVSHVLSV